MYRYAAPFPVPSSKSDAEAKGASDYFRAHPDDYQESRRRAGITLERAYLMKTPMGNFVVAYVECEKGWGETYSALFDPSLAINRWFADFIKNVHEFDAGQIANMPPPETVGEWVDPDVHVRKRGLAFTAPVIPGMEEAGRAFAKEAFVTRRDEFTASRRALGESIEVVTLLETPMGPVISVYLEGDDPVEANRRFAASESIFDRWFKDECRKIFPPAIDFDIPLPPIEAFFDSAATVAST